MVEFYFHRIIQLLDSVVQQISEMYCESQLHSKWLHSRSKKSFWKNSAVVSQKTKCLLSWRVNWQNSKRQKNREKKTGKNNEKLSCWWPESGKTCCDLSTCHEKWLKKAANNDAIMKPVSFSVLKISIDYRFPELLFSFNENHVHE